ncbi:MAG: tRNA (adenosine(37)-N6)-threonylcarbamoyltransferase complex ATPase subunit type 1 TsaE [Pseudomonadota bacterium]
MSFSITIDLDSEGTTAALAEALAPNLSAGDVICLHGSIGAGKSVFARAIIRNRLNAMQIDDDIPSPTYTLVQTYRAGDLEIWHSDLYRLNDPQDVAELGLDDAFRTGLCLIEWPERLGTATPDNALHATLSDGDHDRARRLTLASSNPDWAVRLGPVLTETGLLPHEEARHACR